jgi:NTE family protein
MRRQLKIGLALGGGGVAALASAGVVQELLAAGISIDCAAGTSAGAIVGAAFATGRLDFLCNTFTSLGRGRIWRLFDVGWPHGGLMEGQHFMELIEPIVTGRIEDMPLPFAAVATDLDDGTEVVLRHGSIADAIRASCAIPGLFTPHRIGNHTLVDGGLVDPLPVSVARRLGADFVIAVDLLHTLPFPGNADRDGMTEIELPVDTEAGDGDHEDPGILTILARGSTIVQAHIAQARLQDDPPEFSITPQVDGVSIFDFAHAKDAIKAGRRAGRDALDSLRDAIDRAAAGAVSISRRSRPKRARLRDRLQSSLVRLAGRARTLTTAWR